MQQLIVRVNCKQLAFLTYEKYFNATLPQETLLAVLHSFVCLKISASFIFLSLPLLRDLRAQVTISFITRRRIPTHNMHRADKEKPEVCWAWWESTMVTEEILSELLYQWWQLNTYVGFHNFIRTTQNILGIFLQIVIKIPLMPSHLWNKQNYSNLCREGEMRKKWGRRAACDVLWRWFWSAFQY